MYRNHLLEVFFKKCYYHMCGFYDAFLIDFIANLPLTNFISFVIIKNVVMYFHENSLDRIGTNI